MFSALKQIGRAAVPAYRATTVAATTRFAAVRHLSEDTKSRIDGIVTGDDLVVFMKGNPQQPQCGFSRTVCILLEMHGVDMSNLTTHNILEDEELRSGIKEYSDWPTIPQVYFKGEFAGGCDILIQMHQNGELVDELASIGIESTFTADGEE